MYRRISFDILNMLVTRQYRFSKKNLFSGVTRPDLSGVPLISDNIQVMRGAALD